MKFFKAFEELLLQGYIKSVSFIQLLTERIVSLFDYKFVTDLNFIVLNKKGTQNNKKWPKLKQRGLSSSCMFLFSIPHSIRCLSALLCLSVLSYLRSLIMTKGHQTKEQKVQVQLSNFVQFILYIPFSTLFVNSLTFFWANVHVDTTSQLFIKEMCLMWNRARFHLRTERRCDDILSYRTGGVFRYKSYACYRANMDNVWLCVCYVWLHVNACNPICMHFTHAQISFCFLYFYL